jgi:hypothetical protein
MMRKRRKRIMMEVRRMLDLGLQVVGEGWVGSGDGMVVRWREVYWMDWLVSVVWVYCGNEELL